MKSYLKYKIQLDALPDDVFESASEIYRNISALPKKEGKQLKSDLDEEISFALRVALYEELNRIAFRLKKKQVEGDV